jgi:hypothetical protein
MPSAKRWPRPCCGLENAKRLVTTISVSSVGGVPQTALHRRDRAHARSSSQ